MLERQAVEQGLERPTVPGSPDQRPPEPVRLASLAATIDRDVFGGVEVSEEVVTARWTEADAATAAVYGAAGRIRRIISRYRIRSRR